MELNIKAQTFVFLLSFPLGAVIGIIFDFFRTLRKSFKTGTTTSFFEDILFWIIAAAMLFLFSYYYNNGELRGFVLFGAAMGFFLYFITLAPYVLKIMLKAVNTVKKAVKYIYKAIRKPILFILTTIKKMVKIIKRRRKVPAK